MGRDKTRIVAIGGVAAGPKAAARARRCNPQADITLIEQGEYLSYSGCGTPFYVGGMVKDYKELMTTPVGVVRDANFFKNVKDIKIISRTKAEHIDRDKKEITLRDLDEDKEYTLPYDKLVVATGSSAFKPGIRGMELPGVFVLKSLDDALAIRAWLDQGAKKVVIIGGGLVGLELAENFIGSDSGLEVMVIEIKDHVLPGVLDREMALLVEKRLKAKGVRLVTGEKVTEVKGEAAVQSVAAENGEFPADMVIAATGFKPNVELAARAGLEVGPTGALKVNDFMQTNDPDIYAGGDCVESTCLVTGGPTYAPMGSVANRHGRAIGSNICGGEERVPPLPGTVILKVFDFNVGKTGLTERQAAANGYEYETFISAGPDRAHFYPGNNPVIIKLIAEKGSRRVLGAQMVGPGQIDRRLDVIAAALSMDCSVDQVANFDLAYAPPFSTAIDPLINAANGLRNKLDGMAKSVGPAAVLEKLERCEDFVLLDVRSPGEYSEVRIPCANSVLIPLGKLRERAGELPRDKEIVAFCKVSLRGYEAQILLEDLGFENVKFFEGGVAAWPAELEFGPQD